MSFEWLNEHVKVLNLDTLNVAKEQQSNLTKPAGSLGQLETLAIRLAAMQGTLNPSVDRVWTSVFAADHGVAAQGVSAFPQVVTQQMLRNFVEGGAAISVLAKGLNGCLEVIDVGVVEDLRLPSVINDRVAPGTADFSQLPAMTETQLSAALTAGRRAVERALTQRSQLFIGGEMGIGNTTAATALACALLALPAKDVAGPGTGLDAQGVRHKIDVIDRALALHNEAITSPLYALACLGGFEIAALTGAYVYCAQLGLPVLVDGFIASVSALAATRINPGVSAWLIYSHQSAEPGHQVILDALDAKPLLALNMRLGEGSGAAVALPLLRMACALHNDMATFDQAGVSTS